MDRIKEFVLYRNQLYVELNKLIYEYLTKEGEDWILAYITGGRGWISNVSTEQVLNPPPKFDVDPADTRTIVVSCTERAMPFIFVVNKELTKVYFHV